MFRLMLLSYGPGLIAVAVSVTAIGGAWDLSGEDLLLFALLGTVNGGMLGAASLAWTFPLRRLGTIDDLIRESAHRDRIVSPVLRGYGFWQASLPIAAAVIPFIVLLMRGDFDARNIAITANLAWSMLFLGNVSYWLIVPPIMAILMRKCTDLSLRWNDPARTPGIRTLSEGYAYSAIFLALGAFAVTLPGLFGGSPLLGSYLPYLYGLLLGLSLWVGAFTQFMLFTITRRFRLRMMDTLAGNDAYLLSEVRATEIFEKVRASENAPSTRAAYDMFAGAPSLPYGTGLIVQYAAAIFGSVVGFLLQ
ncbi:hypothetical protein I7412_16335 [Frankia sp. CN6]|uniref:Uncharacterized protein n=3 Tax=Frankia nepalensis TaxID=1836974 RepID=A0A937RGS2_9ACTN|nr:hypothetical protein [Frankia nepalensis]